MSTRIKALVLSVWGERDINPRPRESSERGNEHSFGKNDVASDMVVSCWHRNIRRAVVCIENQCWVHRKFDTTGNNGRIGLTSPS